MRAIHPTKRAPKRGELVISRDGGINRPTLSDRGAKLLRQSEIPQIPRISNMTIEEAIYPNHRVLAPPLVSQFAPKNTIVPGLIKESIIQQAGNIISGRPRYGLPSATDDLMIPGGNARTAYATRKKTMYSLGSEFNKRMTVPRVDQTKIKPRVTNDLMREAKKGVADLTIGHILALNDLKRRGNSAGVRYLRDHANKLIQPFVQKYKPDYTSSYRNSISDKRTQRISFLKNAIQRNPQVYNHLYSNRHKLAPDEQEDIADAVAGLQNFVPSFVEAETVANRLRSRDLFNEFERKYNLQSTGNIRRPNNTGTSSTINLPWRPSPQIEEMDDFDSIDFFDVGGSADPNSLQPNREIPNPASSIPSGLLPEQSSQTIDPRYGYNGDLTFEGFVARTTNRQKDDILNLIRPQLMREFNLRNSSQWNNWSHRNRNLINTRINETLAQQYEAERLRRQGVTVEDEILNDTFDDDEEAFDERASASGSGRRRGRRRIRYPQRRGSDIRRDNFDTDAAENRIQVILGMMDAGNDNKALQNQLSNLVDYLYLHGKIDKKLAKDILKKFVM